MARQVVEEEKCSCWKSRHAYSGTCIFKETEKHFIKRRRTKQLCTLGYSEFFLVYLYFLLQVIFLTTLISTDAKLLSSFNASKNETYYLIKDAQTYPEYYGGSVSENEAVEIIIEGKIKLHT